MIPFSRTCLSILLFVCTGTFAFAADSSPNAEAAPSVQLETRPSTTVELNPDYIKGYWTDTKTIVTAPFHWNSDDWLKASLIMGTATVLYIEDDTIKDWVQRNKNNTASHLSDDAKTATKYSLYALGGLGLYGYAASDGKAKTTFLLSGESFLITGAFVQVLKHATGRHRPYTGDSHDTWSGPTNQGEFMSFPSGDASSAFSIVTVIATEYDNAIVPPIAYGLATLIALERVYNNAHWSSDVFLGSALGYFTGKTVVASHSVTTPTNLSIAPIFDGSSRGLLLTYQF